MRKRSKAKFYTNPLSSLAIFTFSFYGIFDQYIFFTLHNTPLRIQGCLSI